MNIIQLTNDQQNKLIILCNSFYPEYIASFGALANGIMVFRKHGTSDYIYAHWFEFVVNDLSDRVWCNIKPLKKQKFVDHQVVIKKLGSYLLDGHKNIIDSLYHIVTLCNTHEYFINPITFNKNEKANAVRNSVFI